MTLLFIRRHSGSRALRSDASADRQATRALPCSFSSVACLPLLLLMGFALPCVSAEPHPDEGKLIAILESSTSSAREKDAACAVLKRIGTARSVPALARLLPDAELSHSARYALESMPFKEAGAPLIAALPKTSGATMAGVIHSLQARGETTAIPHLAGIVVRSDEVAACAAASALGGIGGSDAAEVVDRALRQVRRNQRVRLALADSSLKIAQSMQVSGAVTEALSRYKRLTEDSWPEHIRVAAWRGVFMTSGKRGLSQLVDALGGDEVVARTAALNLVSVISVAGSATAIAETLPKLSPDVQVAVLGALAQRGDPAVAKYVADVAQQGTPETCAAAVAALGVLGNSNHVRLLAERASAGNSAQQAAARQALAQLNRGPVSQEMTTLMASAPAAVQSELARALGERREASATPALLELAWVRNGTGRSAALQALGAIAGPQDLASLVDLVVNAAGEEPRAQAAEALNSAVQRLLAGRGQVDLQPIVAGLERGSAEVRATLLRVGSGIVAEPIRQALRQAVSSSDKAVRAAGISAMSDTVDPGLLPDLTEVAVHGTDALSRNQAIAGIIRLWGQEEPAKVDHAEKLNSARKLAAGELGDDQWRKLLAGLAELADPEVLPIVQAQLGKAAVKNEAARALVKLASSLTQTETARQALSKLDLASLDEGTRHAALGVLKQFEARLAFLTGWQVSGPYRQAGKGFSELYDIPFGPETAERPEWKPAQFSADPAKPYAVDLLRSFGGEQCVAYARTEIQAENEADGVLEIGSDDGIKIWLNGTLVHANNTARPLQPGQDKARVRLKPGPNQFLVKLTQNNLGWEFCIKLVNPEGRLIPGITASRR